MGQKLRVYVITIWDRDEFEKTVNEFLSEHDIISTEFSTDVITYYRDIHGNEKKRIYYTAFITYSGGN